MSLPDETRPLLTNPSSEAVPPSVPAFDPELGGLRKNERPNIFVVFPAITIGTFLSAADGTIALVSYVTISSELDALNMASWIITAYSLSLVSTQPLYGKLCDIFGRKQCLLVAYVLFAIGCLGCGLAQSMVQIILARVVQAIGGAGMGTVVSILLTDLVPSEDRGLWQGVLNIVYSIGASLGAPLGGLLTGSVGWRWSFFGQVPVCLLAIAVVTWCLEDQPVVASKSCAGKETLVEKLGRVDFWGTASLVAAIAAFMLGVDRGSNISWTALETSVSFCVALAAIVGFVYVETCVAREPIVPPSVLTNHGLMSIFSSAFLGFFSLAAIEFLLPLYYQVTDGLTPQEASVFMIPSIFASVCSAMSVGFWMRRTGQYYYALQLSVVLQVMGTLLTVLLSGTICGYAPGLVMGHVLDELGIGNSVVSALIAAIANAGENTVAVVTASYYAFRSLGYVLGISIVSTIVQQHLRDLLRTELQSFDIDVDSVVYEVTRSLASLKTLSPEVASIVRVCYGIAMNKGFYVVFAMAVAGAIAGLWIPGGRIRRTSK